MLFDAGGIGDSIELSGDREALLGLGGLNEAKHFLVTVQRLERRGCATWTLWIAGIGLFVTLL